MSEPGGGSRLDLTMNLDAHPWTDLIGTQHRDGELERMGLLPGGTIEGRMAVGLVVRLADDSTVVLSVPWRLFYNSVAALAASPGGEADLRDE